MADRIAEFMEWVELSADRDQGELPAFPGVAARLVDLLEQPDAEISAVESLVAQDQVVSARVLRMANSAIYGGAMPVETVNQAVLRLGFRETAQVAMTAACRSLFNMEDRAELEIFPEVWHELWVDSLVCAYGGRLLARELKRGEAERIFLGSMFRNIGGLFILKMVASAMVRGELASEPSKDELQQAIEALHSNLGASYLERAGLPGYIARTAARHHDVELPFDADHIDLHLVRLADGLCQRIGVSPFATGMLGPLAEESAVLLDVSLERIETFELQFSDLMQQLGELG